ncbi:hypothetical protein ACFL6R_03615 [Gemmatimonadota bacterium]
MRDFISRVVTTGVLALAVLAIPALASAQNPDFTGTWKYNEAESELPDFGGGGGGGRGGGGFAPAQLTITQKENEVTIARPETGGGRMMGGGGTQVITVDGEPHEVETGRGTSTVTASWKEGKLVVVTEISFGDRGEMVTTTTYSLSEDGQKLIQAVEMDTPMGAISSKLVFDLQK